MIEFVSGDMFAVTADIRVNTVNCVGVMGAGVALAFKKRYPDMYKEYKLACKNELVAPGKLHVWRSLIGDWVINFPTKRDWRDPSRYEDVEIGLDALYQYLQPLGRVTIALPALGCGHGGLDWNRVSKMIENKLSNLEAHLLVFTPSDSRAAGRKTVVIPSDDELNAVNDLGYERLRVEEAFDGYIQGDLFIKGNRSLLRKRWITLFPSREPSDRELHAINAVVAEIASRKEEITLAILHVNRSSEKIASICNSNGLDVVMLLPFGVLTRKLITQSLKYDGNHASTTLLSIAPPSLKWSQSLVYKSANLMTNNASSALISDPELESIKKHRDTKSRDISKFYLRYGEISEDLLFAANRENAQAIGRRPTDGTPNIDGLLGAYRQNNAEPLMNDRPDIVDLEKRSLPPESDSKDRCFVKIDSLDFPENCWSEVLDLILKGHTDSAILTLEIAGTSSASMLEKKLCAIRENYH